MLTDKKKLSGPKTMRDFAESLIENPRPTGGNDMIASITRTPNKRNVGRFNQKVMVNRYTPSGRVNEEFIVEEEDFPTWVQENKMLLKGTPYERLLGEQTSNNTLANNNFEYGGYLLPKKGFGSWLKENSSGLLQGAGALASAIPGVGAVAGPLLNIAGAAIGKKQADAEMLALRKEEIAAQKAFDEEQRKTLEKQTRTQNLFGDNQNINYGGTFAAYGGDLFMSGNNNNVPNIVEYSKKADLHSEGIGGVPVDVRGNPITTSKTSAVAMTEGGEVTWNGYVFSNRLTV